MKVKDSYLPHPYAYVTLLHESSQARRLSEAHLDIILFKNELGWIEDQLKYFKNTVRAPKPRRGFG